MPVRALRFLHAANLRLEAALALPGAGEDLQPLLAEATATAFAQIVTTALEQDVDALLITGNTFDAAAGSLSAEVTLRKEFRRLDEHGLPVFVTPGLIDPALAWQDLPSLPDNVTVFANAQEPGADIIDRGRTLATVLPVSSVMGVDAPELERIRAAGTSTSTRGITIGLWIPDTTGTRSTSLPAFASLTYLAASDWPASSGWPLTEGRVHQQSGPQGLDAHETGLRGCQLVEIDADGEIHLRLIPVAPVRWETCSIDGRGVTTQDELCDRMLNRLEQLGEYPGERLRIITWSLSQTLLESLGIDSDLELQQLQQTLVELTDQPKHGLRYWHQVETVWDSEQIPVSVDRELWHDFAAEMDRVTPLEMERLKRLWQQKTGDEAPPVGWPVGVSWPPVNPEHVRQLALRNGRRWFRPSAAGKASR